MAGAGTSAASMNYLIMACALFPTTVKKAQEELDRVVGPSRLPTLEDEPNLPYVRAMIKECLRWRPFSNQGTSAPAQFEFSPCSPFSPHDIKT